MNKKQTLVDLGSYLKEKQMLLGSSGNISLREDEGFVISASGTELDDLLYKDLTLCDFKGHFEGKPPSKEVNLHKQIYMIRKDINCVIHCSPFYATLVACSDIPIKKNLFVESMYYLENMIQIPFAYPGSDLLENFVKKNCKFTNVILMQHHGVLVYGETLEETKTTLEVLEVCCRMNVLANSILRELPEEEVMLFLEKSGYKKRKEWERNNEIRCYW